MAGLQRSAVSFRRQGSSGFVWDDRFLTEEINKANKKLEDKEEGRKEQELEKLDVTEVKAPRTDGITITIDRSRSNGGGRGYRTGKVSPAIEPPSPKVSACGFCSAFGKPAKKGPRTNTGKLRSR
ncbi:uncharacterized protein At1g15400-like [Alnus glutinosa]|uniref:uncharacterized protein At1g15400-like n=1 Tax=Alnus glutinosa TaxID=3517 RepID=UPI002D787943|nr:uncharacterized protein At1g15400-like [Alnus glutinosa]